MKIEKNELIHSTELWDAKWSGMNFTLQTKKGEYLLKIKFDTPNKIQILKGHIHYNETDIIIDEDALFIANNKMVMSKNSATDCKVGLSISGMKKYPESFKEIKKYFKRSKKELLRR